MNKNLVVLDPFIKKEELELPLTEVKIDGNIYPFSMVDAIPQEEMTVDDFSVVVEIQAFSCNYRDRGIFSNFRFKCDTHQEKDSLAYMGFGSDFVGIVVKLGAKVHRFNLGDRVMADHSFPFKYDGRMGGIVTNYASIRYQTFKESSLIKVPKTMTDNEDAAFSLAALTAHSMVRKAQIKKGDNILVTSPFSNTSLACLELLKSVNDVSIFTLTTHPENHKELDDCFNIEGVFTPSDFSEQKVSVKFDVILDPFIDIHIDYITPYCNSFARYVSCGYCANQNLNLDMYNVFTNMIITNTSVIANCIGLPEDLISAINLYNQGKYKVHIDSVFAENNISNFLERSFNQKHFGKVIFHY